MVQKTRAPRAHKGLRAATVAALATAGLATTGIVSPAAQATTSHNTHLSPMRDRASTRMATTETFTIPAGVLSYSSETRGTHVSVTKSAAQLPQSITCTLTVNTPFRYYGGPYPGGGEEGLATTQCTGVVWAIQVEVALFYNGTQVTYNSHTNYSTTTTTADTEYPLHAGNYYTGADSYITWTYGGSTAFIPLTNSPTTYLP